MDEKKKLINWTAGISTVIVALLIIIVVMEPRGNGVSRAAASRAIALTLAGEDAVRAEGPETSFFPGELQDQWYVKYMDYLYAKGYLDPETCYPSEGSAVSAVTYGELSGWVTAAKGEGEPSLAGYVTEAAGKKAGKAVDKAEFWEFYDAFRAFADPDGNVKEIETDLYGTPGNVDGASPWTAYTKDGKFLFEGLSLDSYIDKTIKLLVREDGIIKVQGVVSDEIVYENAWISGFSGNTVTVFIGNIQREFPVRGVLKNEEEISGQIGDLYLKNGKPSRLVLKKETITGTVLSVREDEIEIEGYGTVPLSEDFKIYRTYGVLKEQKKSDILVGYHMQTFVVAGDEICAALTTEKPEIDNIRVLLMTTNFKSLFHPEITLVCDSMAVLEYGDEKDKKTQSVAAGEPVTISAGDSRLESGRMVFRSANEGGMITVRNIERSQGTPVYPGHMEITGEEEGLLLLNEVDLEEYLKRVVPSEMPSGYEIEALKAQAVCARSYAYRQMAEYGYPEYEAHVDDSTNYQVYGNSAPADSADLAVQETAGQVVRLDGEIVTTYYYSTSCGKTTSMKAWGNEENEGNRYLQSVEVKDENGDYERNLPWYRWEAKIPAKTLSNLIGLNTGKDIGTLQDINILENGPGGVVLTIEAVGDKGSVRVSTENKIRRAFGGKGYTIIKHDGTQVKSSKLLPSAFFTINKSGDIFVIQGGGFGHGIGMSQTGANEMAKSGKNYQEILTFFYQGVTIG